MFFSYKIRTSGGEIEEGEIDGVDKYSIAQEFVKQGKTVIFVKEKSHESIFNMDKINLFLARIKLQDKITFSRNLSAMLSAGLSLSRGLGVLDRQTKNPKFKKIMQDLGSEIGKGNSLSDAMSKNPKVFSSIFVSMVHAGEESGNLAQSLEVIGVQLDKSYALRRKVKGAMIYPAVVISAMIIIGVLMMIFVVPTLSGTFLELGVELPASTKAVIALSDFLVSFWYLALLLVLVIFALVSFAGRTTRGKRSLDWFVLHIPIISNILKNSYAANTMRTLSSLLSSGVDMIEAIEITKDVMQNSYFKEIFDKAIKDVQKGTPLSAAFMQNENLYPVLVGEMVEVGEETGKLSDMMMRTAIFYEEEVDSATKNMSTIIEPFLMVIIGVGVGFFAISMITPMYSLVDTI